MAFLENIYINWGIMNLSIYSLYKYESECETYAVLGSDDYKKSKSGTANSLKRDV